MAAQKKAAGTPAKKSPTKTPAKKGATKKSPTKATAKKGATKAPAKKSPTKATAKKGATKKSAAKAPTKKGATKKSAAKAPTKKGATTKSAAKTPAKKAAKTPAKKAAKTPAKKVAKTPAKKAAKTPAKKPAKTSAEKTATKVPSGRAELARVWNEQGRAHFTEYSARLARLYAGERDVDLDLKDPRSHELGHAVMREVVALHAAGHGAAIREHFDPAYGPLFPWIERTNRQLGFVTLLGADELLVRRGSPWQRDGQMLHLRGEEVRVLDGVIGACRSRNRDHLVLARQDGLEFRDARAGLDAPAVDTLPWPSFEIFRPRGLAAEIPWENEDDHFLVERLQVSDDGMRVVVSCYRQGILLGSRHLGEPRWTLLWPDARPPYQRGEVDEAPYPGDMTHVAISRDGRRVAFGSQDAGHFVAELDETGEPQWYATVGHLSEYPHDACFSDDGRFLALNSCHFYQGATISFDLEGHRGVELDAYETHPEAPCVDGNLRVYASCWLDRAFVEALLGPEAKSRGAFFLAGSGIFRVVGPAGGLGVAQGFGSSASSVDFCPETRRLALGAYSGFVHVYAIDEDELPGRIDGFRARREVYRWLTWEQLPNGPIRW